MGLTSFQLVSGEEQQQHADKRVKIIMIRPTRRVTEESEHRVNTASTWRTCNACGMCGASELLVDVADEKKRKRCFPQTIAKRYKDCTDKHAVENRLHGLNFKWIDEGERVELEVHLSEAKECSKLAAAEPQHALKRH
jgi:hypothetical protein